MKLRYVSLILLVLLTACDSLPSWMGGGEKQIKRLPGEREDVLKADVSLKPDEIVQQVSFKIPPAQENAAWAQATGPFTSATGNLSVKGDLSSKQSASAGKGNAFVHTLVPRPVVADGRVFVMDASGYVSAHEAQDIAKKLWISPLLASEKEDQVMGGGLAFDGGKLYAVSGLGRIAALDATAGTELWHRDLDSPIRSAPRVAGDTLFVITIDSQLYALEAASGKVLWTHRGIGETAGLMNSISPSIVADSVIVPYASGELYALKRDTGDEIWRASLSQAKRTEATAIFSGIGGDPVVDESVVFAASSGGTFSVLGVLNGQPLWEKKVASINTPWLVGEYIFVLTEDSQLLAMVKYDGRIRWSIPLQRYDDEKHKLKPIIWRGPVMVTEKLVVVSDYGQMLVVDGATVEVVSTHDIADEVETAPIVADGKLFVVGKDATLYSYQ